MKAVDTRGRFIARQKRKPRATVTHKRTLEIVQLFLRYSFKPIHYSYRGLTNAERALCTPAEFRAVVRFVKAKLEVPRGA